MCDHDWRRDPFTMLTVYPPAELHVCAICGARRTQTMQQERAVPNDVRTWPKVGKGR